ncbi:MAG: tetratricopeptide repeat protein, partial [Chitinophagales bacterium]|nr:tetratricopeptide repeat protein [Chitinophagales bacterium]
MKKQDSKFGSKNFTRFSITIFVALLFILLAAKSFSQVPFSNQPEKTQTRSGNKNFESANYTEAETDYKKALDIKNNMPEATFNLGDAVYNQKRYDDAQKQFQLSAQTNANDEVKAKAYHNIGNTFLELKKWDEAVKAYKSALKINPADEDSKYNLAYANAMLQNNKGDGAQNNKDQNGKDKDQQSQNKDENQKQDQKQDQQANNQDQKNQQQKQGQQPKLSKEDADKLLAALM